ncbi:response regulator [Roseateles chitinivorans]|uniref:response regulator n=1 Tax=Roseateles chitinivorans TaxID=2917965 RepID=UPI003D6756EB
MKILLVDPSPSWIATLRYRLGEVPGTVVVAQCACEEHAVITAALCQPDVVICDVALSEGSGLNTVARMRKAGFRGAAFAISNADEVLFGPRCMEAGFNAFYSRECELDVLLDTLREFADTPLTFNLPKLRQLAVAA